MNHLTHCQRIRIRTFLVAAFAVLLGFVFQLQRQNRAYRQRISLNYARAFSQLSESMGNLDTALEKSIYVTTPEMIAGLCAEIYSDAASARQAASTLPYANVELEQTIGFAARTGDYAQSLAKAAAEQKGYRKEDLENLKSLSKAASTLSGALDELEAQLNEGTLTLEDVEAVQLRLSRSTNASDSLSQGSFSSLEESFPELPTLIYDGPFSEHMQSRRSAMLENEAPVTVNQARKRAASFLGLEQKRFSAGTLVEGQIPCYRFQFSTNESPDCTVDITQKGGYVLALTNGRAVGAARLSQKEGIQRAKEWLEAHDITDLTESYSLLRDNALTINFAAVQDGVICYPDLIKVEVALDNGEIVGLESAGFLMNHTQREELQAKISHQQAEKKVSTELTILSRHLVLIPTRGEHERLCWEFRCQNQEKKHYLVYINAITGAEEEILILLEDESGTLAL
jgi:germination protein YpeB